MKSILYTLIFLLVTVPLIAQKANITQDSLDVPTHKPVFNYTDLNSLNNKSHKDLVYLPDSIIRTEILDPNNFERYRKLFSHDFYGNEIENIDFIENNDIEWDSLNKHTATFDTNNNRTQRIYYEWNTYSEQWDKTIKIEYEYDTNSNLIQSINYSWDTDYEFWHPVRKRLFEYDNNNLLQVGYIYNWNVTGYQFNLSGKVDYFYNTAGLLIQTISYSWYPDEQKWKVYSNVDYFYDSYLYLKNYYLWVWDYYHEEGQWEYYYYWEYSYYPDGQLLQYIYTSLIDIEKTKHDFTYYVHGNIEEELISKWNYSTESWEDWHDQYLWYYTLQEVSDISDVENAIFQVFPNPAKDILQFQTEKDVQIEELSIYDTQGKKIRYKTRLENNKLDISDLPTGVYIYKIQSETAVQTGKIVIKK